MEWNPYVCSSIFIPIRKSMQGEQRNEMRIIVEGTQRSGVGEDVCLYYQMRNQNSPRFFQGKTHNLSVPSDCPHGMQRYYSYESTIANFYGYRLQT